VIDSVFDGFFMATAYRVPDNSCHCVAPGTKPDRTVPIGKFDVRSFVTNLHDGESVKAGRVALKGIAFDGGAGIASVSISTDGKKTWTEAKLGEDLGRYSFREWQSHVHLARGVHGIAVRAVDRSGEGQPDTPRWNPSGYMRNVVETISVTAV